MKKLTTVRFNPNGKTPISPVQWVSLYCDLACHIESKLYPNRKTHNILQRLARCNNKQWVFYRYYH
jgi:hypothetical protein